MLEKRLELIYVKFRIFQKSITEIHDWKFRMCLRLNKNWLLEGTPLPPAPPLIEWHKIQNTHSPKCSCEPEHDEQQRDGQMWLYEQLQEWVPELQP